MDQIIHGGGEEECTVWAVTQLLILTAPVDGNRSAFP